MSFCFDESYLKRSEYSVAMIVTNAVRGDSRVLKTACSLSKFGFKVFLFGVNRLPEREDVNGYPFRISLVENPIYGLKEEALWRKANQGARVKVCIERLTLAFMDALKGSRYDFLHTHDMRGLTIGAKLREEQGVGEAGWIHDIHEYVEGCTNIPEHVRTFYLEQEKEHIFKPTALTTVSPILSGCIAERYKLPHPHAVLNTPRRSDFDLFYPNRIRDCLKIENGIPLLVYSGNLKPECGVHYAVEALCLLPEVHLALISNSVGDYVNELLNIASKKGLENRIHLHRYVPNCDVTSFLRGATAGINPVTIYGNSDLALPSKVFEYIHSGTPVVSSATTAMADFVGKHDCGIMYPAGDVKSFADAVNKVFVRYPQGLPNVGQGSQLSAQYCWEEQEKVILNIYEELLGRESRELSEGALLEVEPILQLPTHAANQPWTLARAMAKIGFAAKSAALGQNPFEFQSDISIEFSKCDLSSVHSAFYELNLGDFKTFHFHFRPLLFNKMFSFPTGFDLLLLKGMGKRVFFHFRGSEIRLNSVFREASSYNYVDELESGNDPEMPYRFNEDKQVAFRDFVLGVCDGVFVNDPEIQCYVPNALIVPRGVDSDIIDSFGEEKKRTIPLIVHAPNRQAVKGTKSVLASIDQLKREGYDFEFQLVENMSHKDAMAICRDSTIIIDQLRIGWYGVLAAEGMAMGKAVVSYVRNDLRHYLPSPPPLAFANPDNLTQVLRHLLTSPNAVARYGELGRKFAGELHSAERIAKILISIYRKPVRPIEPIAVARFILRQRGQAWVKGRESSTGEPITMRHYFREFIRVTKGHGLVAAAKKAFGVIIRGLGIQDGDHRIDEEQR